ncbi:MAG: hypothetical protein JXQ73_02360 [Phycisphaerae bacterium]|nr:hypothetical protein [Phycisphaerae bacterium]
MTGPVEDTSAGGSASMRLPEEWPTDDAPRPIRAVWIPWPIAVICAPLLWFMPKRMGAHFGEVSWGTAFLAHVVWVVYGIGCIGIATECPEYGIVGYVTGRSRPPEASWPMGLGEVARAPMALLARELNNKTRRAKDIWEGLALFIVVELGVMLLALSLAPYATAGERFRRLYLRCWRLTLWATTSLAAFGVVLQALVLAFNESGHLSQQAIAEALWLVVPLYVAWFAWVWICSGLRYAGPAEGPAWESRPPLCNRCGYRLTGLGVRDRCPECGTAVVVSLPAFRQPPAFATAASWWGRAEGYWQTFSGGLFRHGFFGQVAIRGGHSYARRFVIWLCVVSGILMVVIFLVTYGLLLTCNPQLEDAFTHSGPTKLHIADPDTMLALLATPVVAPVGFILLIGLSSVLAARFRKMPFQGCVTIAFYHSGWLIVLAGCEVLVMAFLMWADQVHPVQGSVWLPVLGGVPAPVLLTLGCHLLPLGVLLTGIGRLVRSWRRARFAHC